MALVRTILLVTLLASVSTARAEERAMVVTLAGQAGARAIDPYSAEDVVGPRLTLAWEHAPLPLPATRGFVVGVALVPELLGGAFFFQDRMEGFIGAGIRAELKLAQREMGLLRVTARSNAYLAMRGMAVGEDRDPLVEFAVGQNFIRWHDWTRIGYEVAVLLERRASPSCVDCVYAHDAMETAPGVMFQLYVGWAP
jgi:hypothetical protein